MESFHETASFKSDLITDQTYSHLKREAWILRRHSLSLLGLVVLTFMLTKKPRDSAVGIIRDVDRDITDVELRDILRATEKPLECSKCFAFSI